ncbi:MAG: ATP-binding cassette domain-containing protein [Candidatus Kuenenia sp.]|nr:ATP-binding cassette domain-containing protein [Candidatus Kuenenia hertensis]
MLSILLKKTWNTFHLDVDFTIPKGKITILFGPSGAGKSSILRFISGLERPDDGLICYEHATWFDKERNIHLPPQQRAIGFVFQDYALFPHMTIEQNVSYGIEEKKNKRNEVDKLLSLVGLSGYEDYYPSQLSGGQKQRVALIRALAKKPDLLLMDEPLSAVDWETRRQLQEDLKHIIRSFGVTTLYVTHDVAEVHKLADKVVVLQSGKIVKEGTPEEVFLGKRLSTRIQLAGKVVGIEYDSIMAIVTVLHAEQYFKTLIDAEEVEKLRLRIGEDVIIGAKSSDVVLFKTTVSI